VRALFGTSTTPWKRIRPRGKKGSRLRCLGAAGQEKTFGKEKEEVAVGVGDKLGR